jgi:hypothetical protein
VRVGVERTAAGRSPAEAGRRPDARLDGRAVLAGWLMSLGASMPMNLHSGGDDMSDLEEMLA